MLLKIWMIKLAYYLPSSLLFFVLIAIIKWRRGAKYNKAELLIKFLTSWIITSVIMITIQELIGSLFGGFDLLVVPLIVSFLVLIKKRTG